MSGGQAGGPDYPASLARGDTLLQEGAEHYAEAASANIENFIGTTRIPVGLAGPVKVLGEHARGSYYIPMATTEGTLVASTCRGMKVINASGGAQVRVLREGGIQRAPVFEFDSLDDASAFVTALNADWHWLVPVMEATTSHGKVMDLRCWQMGRRVCVRFSMHPGDAAGQNMVSIAVARAADALRQRFPTIRRHLMAGGLSGEKVSANINPLLGRGKNVAVSIEIPGEVMRRITRAEIADLTKLHRSYSNYALWGGNGNSHHSHSNALTAVFIATGQDPATINESSFAQNIMEHDADRDLLRWEVHLPNINCGTVGGGTGLPTQRECLELMDCYGSGCANRFAELCAVTSLANEISFWGAVCTQEWVSAHADLRGR